MAASLLLRLIETPSTEAALAANADPDQATANRRLHRMKTVGLLAQEPGRPRAPGRLWSVAHRAETEDFLRALFALADAINAEDRRRRQRARQKVNRAKAKRLGIRAAGVQRSSNRRTT